MTARIWSNKFDITLICWRIISFKFLLTAAIFVFICICNAPGLALLLSLKFLFTRGYYISTRVEIFSTRVEILHIIAFLHRAEISTRNTELKFLHVIVMSKRVSCLGEMKFQSWMFNPDWKCPYNEPLNFFVYKFTCDNAKVDNPGQYIWQKVKQITQNWISSGDSLPNICQLVSNIYLWRGDWTPKFDRPIFF